MLNKKVVKCFNAPVTCNYEVTILLFMFSLLKMVVNQNVNFGERWEPVKAMTVVAPPIRRHQQLRL